MELKEIVERVADIRHAKPSTSTRQRVQEAAQELSRAGDMQARVELANEALAAFVAILYEADTDQRAANIDPVTWRLLVPAPWGSGGWRRWGLRNWEAKTLRKILQIRCEARRHPSLFDYNDEALTWHLCADTYPTLADALGYLKAHPVTLAEWRPRATFLTKQAQQRMAKRRANSGRTL